jgi:hypothetical protein
MTQKRTPSITAFLRPQSNTAYSLHRMFYNLSSIQFSLVFSCVIDFFRNPT